MGVEYLLFNRPFKAACSFGFTFLNVPLLCLAIEADVSEFDSKIVYQIYCEIV